MEGKTLVISGCSKLKQPFACEMTQFYLGDIFKKSLEFAQLNQFDFAVISGKLGLILPGEIVELYDQRIKTKKDIARIRLLTIPKLSKFLSNYSTVFLILGNKYFQVIKDLLPNYPGINFFRLLSKNGIFDYKVNIRKAITGDLSIFYQLEKTVKK